MKSLLLALFCSFFAASNLQAHPCQDAAKPISGLPATLVLPGGEQATLALQTPDEVYSGVLLTIIMGKLGEAGHDDLVSAWQSMPAQGLQRVVALHTGTATLSNTDPADAFYESVERAFIELGWDEYRTYAMSGQDPEWDGYSESYIHEDWVDFADKFVDGVTNTGFDYRVVGAPLFSEELTALFPKAAVSEEVCKELYIVEGKEEVARGKEEVARGKEEVAKLEDEISRLIEIRDALKKINATMSGAIESLQFEE